MPYSPLQAANAETATATIPFDGDTVTVVYRRRLALTAGVELWEAPNTAKLSTLREVIERIIVSWDVLDLDGAPMAITAINLRRLPLEFLSAIAEGVFDEVRPSEKKSGTILTT